MASIADLLAAAGGPAGGPPPGADPGAGLPPGLGAGGPPPSIQIPADAGPGGPLDGGGSVPGGPDSPAVADKISQAADLLQSALDQEKDPEDKALIADLIAKAHKFLGTQQKLVDQATGAGPGVKLVRKAQGGGY